MTKAMKARIKKRDNYRCVYCGSTEELTVDHVVPVVKGGSDRPRNLVTACRSCNLKKGCKLPVGIRVRRNSKQKPYSREMLRFISKQIGIGEGREERPGE